MTLLLVLIKSCGSATENPHNVVGTPNPHDHTFSRGQFQMALTLTREIPT